MIARSRRERSSSRWSSSWVSAPSPAASLTIARGVLVLFVLLVLLIGSVFHRLRRGRAVECIGFAAVAGRHCGRCGVRSFVVFERVLLTCVVFAAVGRRHRDRRRLVAVAP